MPQKRSSLKKEELSYAKLKKVIREMFFTDTYNITTNTIKRIDGSKTNT